MTVLVRKAGLTRSVVGIHVRKAGVTKPALAVFLRDGSLKQIFGKIAVSLSRTSVLGRGNSAGTTSIVSASVSATPTGTIGSVTFLWARTSPDGHSWTISNPTASTTSFQTTAAPNEDWSATFTCTVTDSAGQTITSGTVSVDCANNYFGGGGGPYL